MATVELFETDFYAWTQEQSAKLRRTAELRPNLPEALDWQNLAQVIEEQGLSLELELYHRYVILLAHLLKWRFQSRLRGPSWRGTVNEQRRRIARLLKKNPALRTRRELEFSDAYDDARELASDDTGLTPESFPAECPFTLDQIEDSAFLPEPERY